MIVMIENPVESAEKYDLATKTWTTYFATLLFNWTAVLNPFR